MPSCPSCGAYVVETARRCPIDGTPIDPPSMSGPIPIGPGTAPTEALIDAKPDRLVGRVIDRRYRILARLGEGGMGAVYRGEHAEIKKAVAIKVLQGMLASTDEFRRRFEREARAASRLSHPACVSVIDFGRVSSVEPHLDDAHRLLGMPYLVMEFVKGETLAERLGTRRLSLAETVVVARGVASALRHAHSLGILHRDIKPGNIMLTESAGTGTLVKLVDFGLAKELVADADERSGRPPLTEAGMVCGTPTYLSPEQATGAPASMRSDLYALGVVLFEMACGRPPFQHDEAVSTLRDHLHTAPPKPRSLNPAISPELDALILRALEKEPAKRIQSAEEFQALIGRLPDVSAAPAPPPRLPRKLPFGLTPRWAAAFGGGIALVVAGCVALAVVLAGRKPPPAPVVVAAPLPPPAAPAPRSFGAERALELARSGRAEAAVAAARSQLAHNPHDTDARLALGGAYAEMLWCSDAIQELERALHERPALGKEPALMKGVITCLRAKTQGRALRLLEEIGPPAAEPLRECASGYPDAEIRHGCERALERIPH